IKRHCTTWKHPESIQILCYLERTFGDSPGRLNRSMLPQADTLVQSGQIESFYVTSSGHSCSIRADGIVRYCLERTFGCNPGRSSRSMLPRADIRGQSGQIESFYVTSSRHSSAIRAD